MSPYQRIRKLLPTPGREASTEEQEAHDVLIRELDRVVTAAIQYARRAQKREMQRHFLREINGLLSRVCEDRTIMEAFDLHDPEIV